MTAAKLLIPNPPKFEIVKVPPMNSSGLRVLDLAFATRSLVSALICDSDLESVDLIMGVISPSGISTAKLVLDILFYNLMSLNKFYSESKFCPGK